MFKTMAEALNSAEEALIKFDEAITNGNLKARNEAEKEIRDDLKEYKRLALNDTLNKLSATANPVLEGIKMLSYPVKKFGVDRKDGEEVNGVIKDVDQRVDLVKVCQFCKKPDAWQYKVEKLGYLLALAVAKDVNLEVKRLQSLKDDYRLTELAKKLEWGETPQSKTQIGKLLQEIKDELIPGTGKVRLEDIEFLLQGMTKLGREAKTIDIADTRTVHRMILEMCNAIVTNTGYTLNYKKVKEKKAEAVATADTVETPAPEAAQTEAPAEAPKAEEKKAEESKPTPKKGKGKKAA